MDGDVHSKGVDLSVVHDRLSFGLRTSDFCRTSDFGVVGVVLEVLAWPCVEKRFRSADASEAASASDEMVARGVVP